MAGMEIIFSQIKQSFVEIVLKFHKIPVKYFANFGKTTLLTHHAIY
jgi:hypothetical protein